MNVEHRHRAVVADQHIPDPRAVYTEQLRLAGEQIARARQMGIAGHDVADALQSLHTAVAALGQMIVDPG